MSEKKNQERRVTTRVPAVFEVSFIHDGDYLISSTKDISADGMFLHTETPPNVAEKTTLTFSLEDLSQVKVEAEVVWATKSGESKDRGMAVKFINPTPEIQKAILDVVNKIAILTD